MSALQDEPDVPENRRVRIVSDEETGNAPLRSAVFPPLPLSRQDSVASMRSGRSRRSALSGRSAFSGRYANGNGNGPSLRRSRSIDPALALPIEYRTLSIHLDETRERQAAEAAKAKSKTAAEVADLDWHKLTLPELFKRLDTNTADGLSDAETQARLQRYGKNTFSHPPTQWPQKIFWYFFGGFGSILLIGGILVILSWQPLGQPNPQVANLALGIVLFIVFGIQAAFNAWQDFSSSRVMASITSMLPENCSVIRNGNHIETLAPNVVPGDVLLIRAGNKLPADVRFVEISSDAKFDRSILTGESMPIAGTIDSTDDNYLETKCIGLQGTHCVSGSGIGIVVATGDNTIFGRIAKLTSVPSTGRTTLQKEILRFITIVVSLMIFFVVLVVIIWAAYLRRQYPDYINVPQLIVSLVSVGIAFIPEGLPIALTMSLTIVAKTMKKSGVLCKSLKTVETLGTVSVICSDKTGTLTKNDMRATDCSVGDQRVTVSQAATDVAHPSSTASSLQQLRDAAALCNAGEFDASTQNAPLEDRIIHGDATDQAVLRFAEGLGSVTAIRSAWQRRFELAFNSKNKFMIRVLSILRADQLPQTIGAQAASQFKRATDMLLTIKGAPDVLLPRCESIVGADGTVVPLTDGLRHRIEGIKDAWSADGKRVILLARKVLPTQEIAVSPEDGAYEQEALEQARTQLTLVGLIGIVDPPRPEIPEVIATLRRAGIRIFMVTGDFQLTAKAIAIQCGIIRDARGQIDNVSALARSAVMPPQASKPQIQHAISEKDSRPAKTIVLSGPELMTLNDVQWEQLCSYDEVVFARTTPEQKLRIVKEFQSRHNIVGMTGDGKKPHDGRQDQNARDPMVLVKTKMLMAAGVNDAPSLKAADIGIALGSGSDIAIEAADMVLLDSFSGVVAAVQYGRVVFDNLKKTIAYLLPAGSFSEFWPVLTSVIFGLPQILSSFLMIIICCFTDCAGAISLAFEHAEADVMLRPPRDPRRERLVDWRLLLQVYGFVGIPETLTSFAMAYWYAQRQGVSFSILWFGYGNYGDLDTDMVTGVLNESSSIYFVNLVIMQWFNLLALRTRRLSLVQHPPLGRASTQNLYIIPAILFALVIIFVFCYIPGLQAAVATTSVPVEYFFFPMAFGLALLLADEGRKAAVRTWPGGFVAKMAW